MSNACGASQGYGAFGGPNGVRARGARVTVYPDGPLVVRGEFVLDDAEDGTIPTDRIVALCRCGRSARKPLCDGSHKFRARESVCRFGPLTIHYDATVLEPRPWTLLQSEWAARLAADAPAGPILELCAGAGQIGLAAAVLADRDLVQVEADPAAARFARANAARAGWDGRVDVRNDRLQVALRPGEVFPLVVADPPYLRTQDVARWPADPLTAIDGGADGLAVIRACLAVSVEHLAAGGHLVLQVAGVEQAERVAALAAAMPGFGLHTTETQVVDDERAVLVLTR
ncbi:MAG: CDGSH iron-sulfur domain-containing protein [Jatrophihabitans sp.]